MKQSFNGAQRCIITPMPFIASFGKGFTLLLLLALLMVSCRKEATPQAGDNPAQPSQGASMAHVDLLQRYTGLSWRTAWELQQARAATARFQHISNAIKEGYVDINVIAPNMGHHYMKPDLVDGVFDPRKPEILVYNKDHDNNFTLVAVEYAVPITEPMPLGFSGNADVWDGNQGFKLWLLHAWVWSYNPEGVFNPTNPSVHVHP